MPWPTYLDYTEPEIECPDCNGTTKCSCVEGPDDDNPKGCFNCGYSGDCPTCHGQGKVSNPEYEEKLV
jgi:hypothetical protein